MLGVVTVVQTEAAPAAEGLPAAQSAVGARLLAPLACWSDAARTECYTIV